MKAIFGTLFAPANFGHNVRMAHAFRQGDHICSIYDTEEEQLTTAAAYLADGIGVASDACMSVRSRRGVCSDSTPRCRRPASTPPR